MVAHFHRNIHLESVRVRNDVYYRRNDLPAVLQAMGHQINEKDLEFEIEVINKDIPKQEKSEEVREIIEELKNLKENISPVSLLDGTQSRIQETIIERYNELYEYIDNKQLLELLAKAANGRDNRELNNFCQSANFACLDKDEHFKRTVNFHLRIGEKYSSLQLINKWNIIYDEMGWGTKIEKLISAVRLTKLFFKCSKRRSKLFGTQFISHKLISDNPFGLKILKTKYLQPQTGLAFADDDDDFPEQVGARRKGSANAAATTPAPTTSTGGLGLRKGAKFPAEEEVAPLGNGDNGGARRKGSKAAETKALIATVSAATLDSVPPEQVGARRKGSAAAAATGTGLGLRESGKKIPAEEEFSSTSAPAGDGVKTSTDDDKDEAPSQTGK